MWRCPFTAFTIFLRHFSFTAWTRIDYHYPASARIINDKTYEVNNIIKVIAKVSLYPGILMGEFYYTDWLRGCMHVTACISPWELHCNIGVCRNECLTKLVITVMLSSLMFVLVNKPNNWKVWIDFIYWIHCKCGIGKKLYKVIT